MPPINALDRNPRRRGNACRPVWTPAFAGVTLEKNRALAKPTTVMPAEAGIHATVRKCASRVHDRHTRRSKTK
jgi:hypothetical protein